MKASFKVFFLILFFQACTPTYQVVNVKKVAEIKNHAAMYALPKTILRVRVDVVRKITKKGPFAQYADNLLSLKNVVMDDKVEWKIKNIQIGSYGTLDSAQCYAILSSKYLQPNLLSFNEKGLLEGVNCHNRNELSKADPTEIRIFKDDQFDISYSDLAIKSPSSEKVDTIYQGKGVDTMFVKIPTLEKQLLKKKPAEQAKEAADLLLQIRKRKYKNLTGRYTKLLDGIAMQTMVKELDLMESEYLSLFNGIVVENNFSFTFEFIPSENKEFAPKALFYFNDTEGIKFSASNKSKPILIEIIDMDQTRNFKIFEQKVMQKKDLKGGFAYRIPEDVQVNILKDNLIIATKKLQIAQYGTLAFLPIQFMFKPNVFIEFYPELGSIKNISVMK